MDTEVKFCSGFSFPGLLKATQVPSELSWRRGVGWLLSVSCGGCRAGGADMGRGWPERAQGEEGGSQEGGEAEWMERGHVLMAASENLPSL